MKEACDPYSNHVEGSRGKGYVYTSVRIIKDKAVVCGSVGGMSSQSIYS